MRAAESYGIILKTEPEQFRATLFDEQKGKVKLIFFGAASPGMIIRARIQQTTHIPQLQLIEIISAPLALARANIWWFHMILALIDACVPYGSGIGPLYDQLIWLCQTDLPLDKELQMRYCAKIITTLGLQTLVGSLCTLCMHRLHATPVDRLTDLALDSECSLRLATWINRSIEEYISPSLNLYMQHTHYRE